MTATPGDPLFVAQADGANARQILLGSSSIEHNHFPTWSTDGKWIYFTRGNPPTDEWDVWRIAADGGQPERLTEHSKYVGFPTPIDARTVLYVANDKDGLGPWLWTLDVQSKDTRRISSGLDKYLSVAASTDGRRLVASIAKPVSSLWSVPILERTVEEGDVKPYPVSNTRALAPRFGGTSTLFYLSSRGGADGLWRSEAGQSVEVWKGSDGPLFEPPAVSADGRRVAIVLRRNGKQSLRVIAADGSEGSPLTAAIDVRGRRRGRLMENGLRLEATTARVPDCSRYQPTGPRRFVLLRGLPSIPSGRPMDVSSFIPKGA